MVPSEQKEQCSGMCKCGWEDGSAREVSSHTNMRTQVWIFKSYSVSVCTCNSEIEEAEIGKALKFIDWTADNNFHIQRETCNINK